MPKITLLGAGSAFTAGLMRDIMLIPDLEGGELRLVDIDRDRLRVTAALVEKLADRINRERGRRWSVTAAGDRRKVLKGTEYVINCIEVSGLECVRYDNDIPLKYGIDQCIGDTIGPGGIFKALRTVPPWLRILEDIEAMCGSALVMNYTNPMSIMTLAAVRSTSAPVIGLCHSVQGSSREMAKAAGVPYDKMAFKCGGVNHLAWFTELKHNGRNLYPRIFRRVLKDPELYETNPVRFDMMLHFGAFVTESSGHLSEYVPYYRKRKDTLEKYCRDGYRGGSSFYADNWPNWRKASDRKRRDQAKDVSAIELKRGLEYAGEIIEAHAANRPTTIFGSVANTGLITNLPADGVVEVGVTVDSSGFNPTYFGPLPPQMAAFCAAHMYVYDLVVKGIMNRDRESIYQAMALDPLSAAVCTPEECRRMTDEMALAEKQFIPSFMSRGLKKRPRRAAGRDGAGRSKP